jgi:protein-L-isoaspartate(D-aspartate) O-methyltransferase
MTSRVSGLGMTSQRTRARMIERLREEGLRDEKVLAAMAAVPRHLFVEEALASRAYEDTALPLGFSQTISQPYVVARMIELLREGRAGLGKTLEIGTGCGYQAAVLAQMTKDVFSVERIEALLARAKINLRAIREFRVRLKYADGQFGLPEAAPFDTIIVAAASSGVPQALLQQLAPGGRILLPVGTTNQSLVMFERRAEGFFETRLEGVRFVPLLSGIGSRCAALIMTFAILGGTGCASRGLAPVVDRGSQRQSGVPTSSADLYTVKSGDTVYSIAREHGMDFRELIVLNGIENPNQIAVGRVLKIRSKASSVPDTVVTAPVTSGVVETRPIGEAPPIAERRTEGVNTDRLKREPKAGKEPYSEQALAAAQSQGQVRPTEATTATGARPDEKPVESAPGGGAEIAWAWPASGKVIGTFDSQGSKGIDIAGKSGDPVLAVADGKVAYSGTGMRGYGKLLIVKHDSGFVSVYAHNRKILVEEQQLVKKGQRIAEMGDTDADRVKLHFELRQQYKPLDPQKYLPPH